MYNSAVKIQMNSFYGTPREIEDYMREMKIFYNRYLLAQNRKSKIKALWIE